MEIHLCSLSLGHNSSPGRGGGRRGHNFATCRLTCRCYVSRDAVKRLLISDTSPSSRRPGLQRWHCRKGSPQSFQFSRSRCLTEVRTRRSSTETCALSRCHAVCVIHRPIRVQRHSKYGVRKLLNCHTVYGRTSVSITESQMPREHSFGLNELNTQQIIQIGAVVVAVVNQHSIQLVQQSRKMPTCGVVGCENRTSGNVEFFGTPEGSHPLKQNRRHLWLPAKREECNNATAVIEACVCTAHFISGTVSFHSSALFCWIMLKGPGCI